jgi:hypothetical protein
MKLTFPPLVLVFVFSTMCPFFAAGAKYSSSNTYINRDSQPLRNNRNLKDASQAPSQAPFPASISKDYEEDDISDFFRIYSGLDQLPEDLVLGDDAVLVMVDIDKAKEFMISKERTGGLGVSGLSRGGKSGKGSGGGGGGGSGCSFCVGFPPFSVCVPC